MNSHHTFDHLGNKFCRRTQCLPPVICYSMLSSCNQVIIFLHHHIQAKQNWVMQEEIECLRPSLLCLCVAIYTKASFGTQNFTDIVQEFHRKQYISQEKRRVLERSPVVRSP